MAETGAGVGAGGCSLQRGVEVDWSFGDVFWAMVVFFFWFLFIWMFIAIFTDIFRRDDLSGWAKAGWIALVVILPFLGILIYVIVRPKMTEQDKRMIAMAQERERRMEGYSAADEIAKLARLRDEGKITAEEFETMKQRALA
jgi:Short C-terminal domain/Phospholipase_D-nuclease N-terminal